MTGSNSTHFLRSVEVDWESVDSRDRFPFNLELVQRLGRLEFCPTVTYLVGENGSGKSTLLESIAVALGFNPEGGTRNFTHSTRDSHSSLHEHLKLRKGEAARDGFFLRAESFFNLATAVESMDAIEQREDVDFRDPPPKVIASYGGRSLHEQSHGESFFALFMNRFRGRGLYLLDEPEAALSPTRQMALVTRIHELVRCGAQFVVATHSPIVLAYPDASICELTEEGVVTVKYEESMPFVVMRQFVNDHENMIQILLRDDDSPEV